MMMGVGSMTAQLCPAIDTGSGSPSGNVRSDARNDEVEREAETDRGAAVVFGGAPSRPLFVIVVTANGQSA